MNNSHTVHAVYLTDYKVFKNENFAITKPRENIFKDNIKNSSYTYSTESFSTSFSSNKFHKNSNILNACTKNLLNLFNINMDEDKIENIYQERKDIIREMKRKFPDLKEIPDEQIIEKYEDNNGDIDKAAFDLILRITQLIKMK